MSPPPHTPPRDSEEDCQNKMTKRMSAWQSLARVGECFWKQGMKLFIFPFISIYFFNRDATVNPPPRSPSKDSPWGAADLLTPPRTPETLPVPKGSRKLSFENAHVGIFSSIF